MFPPLIFGPIPPYSNVPIEPQNFKPSVFTISNITLGNTTIVTTTTDNNYVIGQQIRILVPFGFGPIGLNQRTGFVISIPASNQIEIDIDSTNQNPFINASFATKPQVTAIGDLNNGYQSSTGKNIPNPGIPGCFQNISA